MKLVLQVVQVNYFWLGGVKWCYIPHSFCFTESMHAFVSDGGGHYTPVKTSCEGKIPIS